MRPTSLLGLVRFVVRLVIAVALGFGVLFILFGVQFLALECGGAMGVFALLAIVLFVLVAISGRDL